MAETMLALAKRLGANAATEDAVAKVVKGTNGGAHGVFVAAVSTSAFGQAIAMTRRHGTVSLVGLSPGEVATPIFDVVLKRVTVRGSIVGTRKDLSEAIAFAVEGRAKTTVFERRLDDINDVRVVHSQL